MVFSKVRAALFAIRWAIRIALNFRNIQNFLFTVDAAAVAPQTTEQLCKLADDSKVPTDIAMALVAKLVTSQILRAEPCEVLASEHPVLRISTPTESLVYRFLLITIDSDPRVSAASLSLKEQLNILMQRDDLSSLEGASVCARFEDPWGDLTIARVRDGKVWAFDYEYIVIESLGDYGDSLIKGILGPFEVHRGGDIGLAPA